MPLVAEDSAESGFRVCEVLIRPNRRAAKMGERCGWKGAAGMTGGLAGAARGSGHQRQAADEG